MNDQDNSLSFSPDQFALKINELEGRISALESELSIVKKNKPAAVYEQEQGEDDGLPSLGFSGSAIEASFGEFGLAWIGNIVLLFGIIFLVQFLQRSEMPVISAAAGYISVGGLFLVGHLLRNTQAYMASIFRLNGYLLLYINTFFLHYLVQNPLVASRIVAIILLLAVTVFQFVVAYRKQSQGLAGLAIFMAMVTAILSDATHVMMPISVLVAATCVYLMFRLGWWRLLVFSIIMVYTTELIWFLSNPIMGHKFEAMKAHEFGYIYLFIVAAVYSLIALIPKKDSFSDSNILTAILMNGFGFSFIVIFYVLTFFKDNYIALFATIALFCIFYSIILQRRSAWKVTASLYALYSFVALSVTVYGIYDFPRAYTLLAIQSLLVVTMALWFRSRVIVIMNTGLFAVLLLAYLITSASVDSTNISFALVALVTARILNWKRQRLNITTDLLRNTYLIIGFVMVLYALFKLMPDQYVTLSWSIAAVLYFVLSILLKNIKYRYLALGTMAATAVYLFIVDLAKVEILYRVIAFMFLAIISIVLSLYYTRRRARKAETGRDED